VLFGKLADALSGIGDEDVDRGVDSILGVVASLFNGVTEALKSDEAGDLSRELGRLSGLLMSNFAEDVIAYVRGPEFQDDLAQLNAALSNALGEAIRGFNLGTIDLSIGGEEVDVPIGFTPQAGDPTLAGTLSGMPIEDVREFVRAPSSIEGARVAASEERAIERGTEFEVRVTVEGDTEIVRDVSAEVVSQEQRRTRERSGRTVTPR
jgi:hypothetical protein